MTKTPIEWCDFSVNPIRARNLETGRVGHWCTKVSPGCKFCYSSRLQPRFGTFPFEIVNQPKVQPFLDEKVLESVLRRKKPARIFWCDMTDMFHESHPHLWIEQCFRAMHLTPQHTHLVLTKRAERMCHVLGSDWWAWWSRNYGTANIWLGVSCENQEWADRRIPWLMKTPAAVRFLSCEPLLGSIDLGAYLPAIDWVIIGGESGANARPCNTAWLRDIRVQCLRAGVACFVKQLGSVPMTDERVWQCIQPTPLLNHRNNKRVPAGYVPLFQAHSKGGDISEFPSDLRVREYPR